MRRLLASTSGVAILASLFPKYEAAALLVDTYFDRVHWFMLLFHQDGFRQRWQLLYRQPQSNYHSTAEKSGVHQHIPHGHCDWPLLVFIVGTF